MLSFDRVFLKAHKKFLKAIHPKITINDTETDGRDDVNWCTIWITTPNEPKILSKLQSIGYFRKADELHNYKIDK